jgi:small-conductance mechanosensitive channel/CRP-like cAMP-binding protein
MWDALLGELLSLPPLVLVAGLVLTAALTRDKPDERLRVRTILVLVSLHFVLLPLTATARAAGSPAESGLRLTSWVFAALAGVGMAGTVLFGVLLPLVRVKTPLILRDVIGAIAAGVSVIGLANAAGFPVSGLITTSAVLTAIIGFSLQDTLGNIMGGLALQLDRSVEVGDWIKIGDVSGRVTETRWRYTAIETRNWETVVIANSVLVRSQIVVLGKRQGQPLQWRRWVWFNVDFRYLPSDVISAVQDALRGAPIPNVAKEPAPNCILMDLHESYAKYAVRYWLTDLAVDDPTDGEVRSRVVSALKRAGISLSIPAHAIFVTEDSEERRMGKTRAEQARRLQAVRGMELFHELPEAELEALASGLRLVPFARGEVITRQGAEAHWLYIVQAGEVSVRVAAPGGLEKEVARLSAGDFFGEMSLMTGEPRSATVVAETSVQLYRLEKATFEELVKARPTLAENIAGVLARRRTELLAVREGLDAEGRERQLRTTEHDLLHRIRNFFALDS